LLRFERADRSGGEQQAKYDASFHEMPPERTRLMSPNADMKDKRNTM
jgi:hypothetical protein